MLYLGIVFLLITAIGLVGNTLVIIVIAVNNQLHDSTNFLICNLAIADLLFLVFCVPITAYSYLYSWHFSQAVCYATVTLQYNTCYVSVWTLVLLAAERFLAIRKPTIAKSMRRTRLIIYVCFSLWLLVFVLNFPQMQGVGVLTFQYNGTTIMACVDSLSIANENATTLGARIFYWGFNLGAYVLPLTLSIAFYCLLIVKLWVNTRVETKSGKKMKRHATKMVFTVIVTFALCWFPQNLRFFLRGLDYPNPVFWERDGDLLLIVQSAIQVMAYANSCINPILYSALSERFRMATKCAWRRFFHRDPYYSEYRRTAIVRCESSMQSRTLPTLARPSADISAAYSRWQHKPSLCSKTSLGVNSLADFAFRRRGGSAVEFLPTTPTSNRLTPSPNKLSCSSENLNLYHSITSSPKEASKKEQTRATVLLCDGEFGVCDGDIMV